MTEQLSAEFGDSTERRRVEYSGGVDGAQQGLAIYARRSSNPAQGASQKNSALPFCSLPSQPCEDEGYYSNCMAPVASIFLFIFLPFLAYAL